MSATELVCYGRVGGVRYVSVRLLVEEPIEQMQPSRVASRWLHLPLVELPPFHEGEQVVPQLEIERGDRDWADEVDV